MTNLLTGRFKTSQIRALSANRSTSEKNYVKIYRYVRDLFYKLFQCVLRGLAYVKLYNNSSENQAIQAIDQEPYLKRSFQWISNHKAPLVMVVAVGIGIFLWANYLAQDFHSPPNDHFRTRPDYHSSTFNSEEFKKMPIEQFSAVSKDSSTIQSGNVDASTLLFTSYTADNRQRLSLSRKVAQNHREYAQQQGLHHIVFEKNLAKDSLPYWSKIAGLKMMLDAPELQHKQWFAWLDDDAVITSTTTLLDTLLNLFRPTDHLIVTEDAVSQGMPDIPLNTGVMFVRNSDTSRRIINAIWERRDTFYDTGPYRYANCPNQICFHEQQALTDLYKSEMQGIRIIPQRFHGMGVNTFSRFAHYDDNRNIHLAYNDPEYSKWKSGDFIGQCTGLATKGRRSKEEYFSRNLREECIDTLIEYH